MRKIFIFSADSVADKVDALVIVTDWNEFKSLNMLHIRNSMHRPVLVDGRNIYESTEMERLGFIYRGMGRGGTRAPSVLPPGDTSETIEIQPETIPVGRFTNGK